MEKDIVIGIDCSTTATKAIAWTKNGEIVGEARRSIEMTNPKPGYFEQKSADWWSSAAGALFELTKSIDPQRVVSLAVSNQRETFAVFDENGQPLFPGMVWLDVRATAQQKSFSNAFGAEEIRRISGKPVDVIVPLYRVLWLKEHHPDVFAATRHFADVHCYLSYRLTGKWGTSLASADPTGMLDMKKLDWSHEILDAADIDADIMPELFKSGQIISTVSQEAADATGLLAGTPLVAGGGDGQCAATGTGTVEAGIAYLNLGTALVAGCYADEYHHDQAFRTEIAVADNGYIFETVLKAGTFLIDWMTEQLADVPKSEQVEFLNRLEVEARKSPIGAGGLIVLPFWQGSMTPHWDSNARGVIAGLSGSSKAGDIYRAILEGLALDTAQALEKVRAATGRRLNNIIAIGGGSSSDLFLHILADSLNVPVSRSSVQEASSLGAAMAAAVGANWYETLAEASDTMRGGIDKTIMPDVDNAERYQDLRNIYSRLWPLMSDWNSDLRTFAVQQKAVND